MSEQQSNPWEQTGDSNPDNPWSDAGQTNTQPPPPSGEDTSDSPWGGADGGTPDDGNGWLSGGGAEPEQTPLSLLEPFAREWIPLDTWVDQGVNWFVANLRPAFQTVRWPVDATLSAIESTLQATPPLLLIAIVTLVAWQLASRRLAISTAISLVAIGAIGAWSEAMTTLSLVLTSLVFCLVIGIPTGIGLARSDRALRVARPILDAMQTTPAFVYLVPIVMLFGIGNVPGVVVTIIFAVPPVIRLTNLGIRQVPSDLIEAARSFGASERQLLFKVQLPLAMPTIMAGVNQTLMLALSMVVIASMIAVAGLGQMVLRGIGRLDIGLATVGGIGIVILAIILDRMTQALGKTKRERGARHWYESGPAGLVYQLASRMRSPSR